MALTLVQLPLQPFKAIALGQGGQASRIRGQHFRGRPGDGGVQELLVFAAKLITLPSGESLGHVRLMAYVVTACVTV
jgi:hypothetical protein